MTILQATSRWHSLGDLFGNKLSKIISDHSKLQDIIEKYGIDSNQAEMSLSDQSFLNRLPEDFNDFTKSITALVDGRNISMSKEYMEPDDIARYDNIVLKPLSTPTGIINFTSMLKPSDLREQLGIGHDIFYSLDFSLLVRTPNREIYLSMANGEDHRGATGSSGAIWVYYTHFSQYSQSEADKLQEALHSTQYTSRGVEETSKKLIAVPLHSSGLKKLELTYIPNSISDKELSALVNV